MYTSSRSLSYHLAYPWCACDLCRGCCCLLLRFRHPISSPVPDDSAATSELSSSGVQGKETRFPTPRGLSFARLPSWLLSFRGRDSSISSLVVRAFPLEPHQLSFYIRPVSDIIKPSRKWVLNGRLRSIWKWLGLVGLAPLTRAPSRFCIANLWSRTSTTCGFL